MHQHSDLPPPVGVDIKTSIPATNALTADPRMRFISRYPEEFTAAQNYSRDLV